MKTGALILYERISVPDRTAKKFFISLFLLSRGCAAVIAETDYKNIILYPFFFVKGFSVFFAQKPLQFLLLLMKKV